MLESVLSSGLTVQAFFLCTLVSLALGGVLALTGMFRARSTQSFALTLCILPAAVQMVILLVDGNLGAGVAVAGAFSLVRFRSAPGTAREISLLFLAMAAGLATGMGYLALAAAFTCTLAAVILLLTLLRFGQPRAGERILKITIPENMDFDGLFDDLFAEYTRAHSLQRLKTSNMGTLYELTYRVTLRDGAQLKPFLDALRCRNGNLNISLTREQDQEAL